MLQKPKAKKKRYQGSLIGEENCVSEGNFELVEESIRRYRAYDKRIQRNPQLGQQPTNHKEDRPQAQTLPRQSTDLTSIKEALAESRIPSDSSRSDTATEAQAGDRQSSNPALKKKTYTLRTRRARLNFDVLGCHDQTPSQETQMHHQSARQRLQKILNTANLKPRIRMPAIRRFHQSAPLSPPPTTQQP